MKKFIKQMVGKFGYILLKCEHLSEIQKKAALSTCDAHDFLHGAVTLALLQSMSDQAHFKILQVGANNGVTVDPVFPIAKQFSEQTQLLLIEPQENAFTELKKNYLFHPCAKFARVAISNGPIILWRIREDLQPYYTGIIGSGITSERKDFVARKARAGLPESLIKTEENEGRELIEKFEPESFSIQEVLAQTGFGKCVDWLQIDTEGHDDVIVDSAFKAGIKPKVISYEHVHFGNERKQRLLNTFRDQGYILKTISNHDAVALLQEKQK